MADSDSVSDDQAAVDSNALPFLTSGSGIDGLLKQSPEDFCVDEVPAYEASGEGEFLFLHIEKRGIPTPDLLRHIEQNTFSQASRHWMRRPKRCSGSYQTVRVRSGCGE